jgi:hypothetical protein
MDFNLGDRVVILDPDGYKNGTITGETDNHLGVLASQPMSADFKVRGYLVTLDYPNDGITLFIIPDFLAHETISVQAVA